MTGMCVGSAVRADIRVSIQDRTAADRVSGHLATGILVDGDAVLVPNPPKELLSDDRDLEVLILPTALDDHARIDVIPAWKWSHFALAGGEPTAATAKLLHHSTYAAQIGAVDSGELAAALDELGGDLWTALLRLGAVPDGIAKIDTKLLAEATRIERAQRVPVRTEHQFESHRAMTDGWCLFFCFCSPHHPR